MNYAVGVDLGATFVKLGLVDGKGRIVSRGSFSTLNYSRKEELISEIVAAIKKILHRSKKTGKVLGIGVGVPGLVDSRRGIARHLVNIPAWDNVPLKRIIERETLLPAFIDNDVNLMALGELTFGAGVGVRNLVCLTLGSGVGGGVIIDGDLYRGSHLAAGEVGHIPVSEAGPACGCGSIGCLEAYVGNKYLVAQTVRALKKGRNSLIPRMVKGDLNKITPRILSQAARDGDPLAKEIWQRAGKKIGAVLAGLINLLDPEMIIVGGGVARAGRVLFDPLISSVRARTERFPRDWVKIVPARLGNDAGVIGAAALVMRKVRSRQKK